MIRSAVTRKCCFDWRDAADTRAIAAGYFFQFAKQEMSAKVGQSVHYCNTAGALLCNTALCDSSWHSEQVDTLIKAEGEQPTLNEVVSHCKKVRRRLVGCGGSCPSYLLTSS